jgi:transposase-like protein
MSGDIELPLTRRLIVLAGFGHQDIGAAQSDLGFNWNISETCRLHGIAANLFYHWKHEAEHGAKGALGGKSAAA